MTLAAVGAGACEHDLVLFDRIAEPARNAVDRPLEPRVAESLNLPAVAADEVMVMIAVGRRRLVPRDPVPCIDALHQPKVDESVERPIDGRDSDTTPRPP